MKTLKSTFVFALCLCLGIACEQPLDDPSFRSGPSNDPSLNMETGGTTGATPFCKPPNTQAFHFRAVFYTKRNYDPGPGSCTTAPYTTYNRQVGAGNGTKLGNFTTMLWFCHAGFDYVNGEGEFVAANGDKLFFQVPTPGVVGKILPFEDDLYEYRFQDPFVFTGGTGRFKGASGGGTTDSYVDLFDDNGVVIREHQTDHTWTGTLILPKKGHHR